MMNLKSVENLKSVYKPLKVTLLSNVMIFESTSGTYVLKEKKKTNMKELYDYLSSRNFSFFPPLIDSSREGINVFSYIDDIAMPKEQKGVDFIKIVALLHQKTTFYKDVSQDEYKKIYENVLSQIDYLEFFYEDIYKTFFQSVFPSPSEYLLLSNISKILSSLSFSRQELEIWYEKVKTLNRYRICQIHNHLCLEHFHKDTLLSWEDSRKDSPVIDIINFYRCSYFELPFETILQEYFKICPWTEEEKKLFFIVISIPPKFETKGTQLEQVKSIRNVLDYVFKTESLIRPYYAVEEKN